MIKAIVPEPVVAELKVVVKKSPVASTEPKPTIVVKKKPVPVAKPPTPTQEPRPPKVDTRLVTLVYFNGYFSRL